MPLFDSYIMLDWSGASRRRGNRADTIWIAHGDTEARAPETKSPFSRTEAIHLIRTLLAECVDSEKRALVSFDFAYGYPRDFGTTLGTAIGRSDADLPWKIVWDFLEQSIKDDLETAPARKPSNLSNRFDVANQVNGLMSVGAAEAGPFWCTSEEAAYLHIPQKRPLQPFRTAQGYLVKPLRLTDERARSGSPFRLYGTASVGSQSLTGIARLATLRREPKFAAHSLIWPFETGWATKANWLPKHASIVHAEIYPSVREPKLDTIKDRGQVRAMWEWARDNDREDLLWREFSRPVDLNPGSPEDIAIQTAEGWILGASPTVTNQ